MIKYKIKTLDNFFELEDLKELTSYAKSLNSDDKINVFHNEIDLNDKIINATINKDLLIRLNKKYLQIAISILKELSPKKVHLIDYSDFTIIKTRKNNKFPIHDDTFNKLLSGVVYLYPEKNDGTIFYNSKSGEDKKIIEWEINRAVFFSRVERETWHSYEGDGKKNRVVLVYNLMTRRVKDVFKVEKKNYLIGNLRFKINPYLFRFFKITI